MVKNGLTKHQVEHVAKLANLPLTASEIETFQGQLSEVVKYVQKIPNAKCQMPKKSEKERMERGRKDAVRLDNCLTQEDALSGTENKYNGLFVVPAIFEES